MRYPAIHAGRLERWLGCDQVESLSDKFRNWYGPPVAILDAPGRGMLVHGGGDFSGHLGCGFFASAMDAAWDFGRRLWRASGEPPSFLGAGFTSLSDVIARSSAGHQQLLPFFKVGSNGITGASFSLWRVAGSPAAGTTPSAAPGGNAPTSATTGALPFYNPASANLRLVGADIGASVTTNSILLYDRIFHVAKTMASTATEAVTGVPSRYQSTTTGDEDYVGGNFLFIEVGGTALAATAHNWTTCLYTDQAGNTAQTLPSVTGISGAGVDRLDMPLGSWFCPLAAGDYGIKALTQMQCSASVGTGVINFVIGHPIGVFAFPLANMLFPFDFVTNRNITPKIFDDACLAFMELPKGSGTATTYTGTINVVAAA